AASVTVAENPAVASFTRALTKCGYMDAVEELGIQVADVAKTRVVFSEKARAFRRWEISEAFCEADIIISLPKFKTHGITYVTGAVKNLFGAIPGLEKSKWHLKAPDHTDFADMLLDLNEVLAHGFSPQKPILHVMDAILAQEGEGPGPAGSPRHIGAVLAGKSPVAVDWVATQVAGLDVNKVATITRGFDRDLFCASEKDIEVMGDTIASRRITGFVPTKGGFRSNMMRGPATWRVTRNWLTPKPVPQADKCTLCYQCMKICASSAISKASPGAKTPIYDHDKCIRCYCCAEICPEAAIDLKAGWLQKLLGLFG
ncbi:MAG: DUF362 domain-containing protein, partial [Proteobacteria bacterium]|nr:DUF362 domain-containing protein [Pseudomonadota bacterium]